MINKKTCFVTGANGKIGKKLILKLLEKKYKVVALVRKKSNLPFKNPDLEITISDILDSDKYAKKLQKCDYIFHLAAYQNLTDPNKNNFWKVNVKGTKTILDSALKGKIKKFVYLSTIMVFDLNSHKPINEKSPKKIPNDKNFYIDTKLQALEIIEQYKTKIPIITIYPTIVIDPDEIFNETSKPVKRWQVFLWKKLGGGVPGGLMSIIGNKNRVINYILIDNLIEGIVNSLNKTKNNDCFILGGENITVENFLKQILKIKQKAYLPVRIPIFCLQIFSLLKISKLKSLDNIIESVSTDMRVSTHKANKILKLKTGSLKDIKYNASLSS